MDNTIVSQDNSQSSLNQLQKTTILALSSLRWQSSPFLTWSDYRLPASIFLRWLSFLIRLLLQRWPSSFYICTKITSASPQHIERMIGYRLSSTISFRQSMRYGSSAMDLWWIKDGHVIVQLWACDSSKMDMQYHRYGLGVALCRTYVSSVIGMS
jgi:hypothetical protein